MQLDTPPILFGEPYSVYVRAVRLTLDEKNVEYRLSPVDIFGLGAHRLRTWQDIRSAKSLPLNMPDSACMKRVRSPDMWTRRFRGQNSSL
jgi:hypothetical protein